MPHSLCLSIPTSIPCHFTCPQPEQNLGGVTVCMILNAAIALPFLQVGQPYVHTAAPHSLNVGQPHVGMQQMPHYHHTVSV